MQINTYFKAMSQKKNIDMLDYMNYIFSKCMK